MAGFASNRAKWGTHTTTFFKASEENLFGEAFPQGQR
jgi:hypothetical protein